MKEFDLIELNRFRAFLFDLDGTLADSMPAHNRAWRSALAPYQVQPSDDELQFLAGIPNFETAQHFAQLHQLSVDPAAIVATKERFFESALSSLLPVPAVTNLLPQLLGRFPLAVVSGSIQDRIKEVLQILNLRDVFSVIIGAGDTERGKPHPDPYLKASELLGVPPSDCLVFEDGQAGIQSALAAHMSVVFVNQGQLWKWPTGAQSGRHHE